MMPGMESKGGTGGREAKEEEGSHRWEGGQAGAGAKEIDTGEVREANAWRRGVGYITRTAWAAVRILGSMMSIGDSLVSILESLVRIAASGASMAKRSAEKQRKGAAAVRRRQRTSRKRFQPHYAKSGAGRRWQGEPKKGGRPPFFPCSGIG